MKANSRQIDSFLVEIYKKYSIPFACVVFVLIGAPMGMITRKGGFGVAAGMSLGFFLLYWACLIGGEKLADRELLSPFLSMWVANILLGLAGVYLVFRDSLNLKRLFKVKPI
jgi:lipopolysaccharide export system permease protein